MAINVIPSLIDLSEQLDNQTRALSALADLIGTHDGSGDMDIPNIYYLLAPMVEAHQELAKYLYAHAYKK